MISIQASAPFETARECRVTAAAVFDERGFYFVRESTILTTVFCSRPIGGEILRCLWAGVLDNYAVTRSQRVV